MATHYKVDIKEGSQAKDRPKRKLRQPLKEYVVANPLFKRGKLWKAGDKIELTDKTAEILKKSGDIQ